jgi:tocopherol O-methyltransferase
MLVDNRREIRQYFDETVSFYRLFWHGSTGALHFGMRAPDVRGHRAELLHTNRILADAVGVAVGDRVLDAGCGVGGSSIWLAAHRGAKVVGLTLSPEQLALARRDAAARGVSTDVQFFLRDFTQTMFPAASFDVVWALESSCYVRNKEVFLSEVFRLLRPGGRFVLADGFLRRAPGGVRERWLYSTFKHGLVLPDLPTRSSFVETLGRCGFRAIRSESRLAQVKPSVRRLFLRCLSTYPLALVACPLLSDGLLANSRAGMALYPLVELGILDYLVVQAVKAL